MEIRMIEKSGVPDAEISAHQRIQRAFDSGIKTKQWRGYASFKLPRGGAGAGDDDFDLILVTHAHIVVIELKNWKGDLLESRAGNWYVDGEPRGRSPVPLASLKAKRLASTLQKKLGPNKTPFVCAFVVMDERMRNIELDEGEAASVLYVHEVLEWTTDSVYRKLVTRTPHFDPLVYLPAYDLFFEGQRGRPQNFSLHGYRPDAKPLWEHPLKLYAEFRAKEKADPEKQALLRQWDFGAMGTELIGEGERGYIGLREQRVYEHVEPRNEELSRSLLRPVARNAEADVTRDFAELFVLPPKVIRLSEFINAVLPKLSNPERVILVKSMLVRFADLHDLNVAHRDVGAHCLWIERPAKVVISGFSAAYYPEMATVGTMRERVKVERSNLPEDVGLAEEGTPYKRDVYMLGVLSHLILFGERPPKADGVFAWQKRASDPYDHAFNESLSKALQRDPQQRFENARQLLESINAASRSEQEQVIDLSSFDAHRAKSKARDYAEISAPITDDDDLLCYRSTAADGRSVLVKEWHGIEPDPGRPDVAIRLLSFLERARNLRAASLDGLPKILDYGLGRRSLLVVQEWVEGETLVQWMAAPSEPAARMRIARALVKNLARMHDFEWAHGDIKPDNIVVSADGLPFFVDMLDFRRNSGDVYTAAYLPADYKTLSPLSRDRYSLAAVLNELLFAGRDNGETLGLENVLEEVQRLLNDRTVLALEPLREALEGKSRSFELSDVETDEVTVRHLSGSGVHPGEMVSDNGFFYLTMENSRRFPGAVLMHMTGVSASLTLEWSPADKRITWTNVRRIDLTQMGRAQEKCLRRVRARLVLKEGYRYEAVSLEPSIQEWHQEFVGLPTTVGVDTTEPQDFNATEDAALPNDASDLLTPPRKPLDVKALWKGLLDAEELSLPIAVVTAESRRHPRRGHQILVPCVLEGAGFDPDEDDHTWVERKSVDGVWRRCGELELKDTFLGASAELAIERWSGKAPRTGDRLRLRSNMESASLNRRTAAVDRILEGGSVISNLTDYFRSDGAQPAPMEFGPPADEALDVYAEGDKRLNDSQRDAFRKALQYGPVSLLQGPPGTGKTWFIASLLHYLVTKESARRILVVSQAHEAVNNALEKALELFEQKGIAFNAVRLGHESVVSDPIRHLHAASIEQVYRERFKAEFKERVVRIAKEMGLPEKFAEDAVSMHVSVGRLAQQIGTLEIEIGHGDQVSDVADEEQSARRRRDQLLQAFREICQRDYQVAGDDQPLDLTLDRLFEALASQHHVQAPQAVEKLRNLLKLSDDWLKTLGEPGANFLEFLARSRTVVAGTLVGIGRRAAGVVQNMYDWVIIDEAGRAAPSELAVALQTGRRILLVGDHKQLPPTFSQEVREALSSKLGIGEDARPFASDFERLFDSAYGLRVGATLREQYRMAPAIGELVSDVFYDGRVTTGRAASSLDEALLPGALRHEVTWVDTGTLGRHSFENTSPDRVDCWNETEAEVVMGLLRQLVERPQLLRVLRDGLHSGEPVIGIICMYSKQRELLNRMKGDARWLPADLRRLVKIDTVDSYQGKENRIVILSTVRNNSQFIPGFLRSPNRINVAMSRAMERLIIVGATPMWRNKNKDLPLGQILSKVERMVLEKRASMIPAQEFYV